MNLLHSFTFNTKRYFILFVTGGLLAGCTSLPDTSAPARLGLTLPPAALGNTISVQQHLKVERHGQINELDVALEVDPDHIALVGLALGQRVLSLEYDGYALTSWRHPMLPSQVRAKDVLEDVQLTLWPLEAIAQYLPENWHIEEQGLQRTLYQQQTVIATITYSNLPRWGSTIVLDNLRYQYRLTIQSVPSS